MNINYRFNRDEIGKILKQAAELEHNDNVIDDSEGLTVEELQLISKEVGIHPKYIHQAIEQLNNADQSVTSNIIGGPFTYYFSDITKRTLTDDKWEDIVSEIRQIHGGIGKTNKMGNTFEWEQRKKEVGYIQVSLSPKKDHTKISINTNYKYYASVIYGLTGIIGLTFLCIIFDELDVATSTQIFMGAIGMTGLLTGARFYLSRWMKNKRETYRKLANRFKEMIGTGSEKDHPPITIPERNVDQTHQNELSATRHKIIRE